MKVRIKVQDGQKRSPISVTVFGDDPTLGELQAAVCACLEAKSLPCTNYVLSLNGKEPLETTNMKLTDASIVSGDTVYVMYPNGIPEVFSGQQSSPLVLSDSTNMTIPAGLASLVDKAGAMLQNATDYLCILSHYTMIENGFLPLTSTTASHSETLKSKYASLPEDWKSPVLYQFNYCYAHPHLQETSGISLVIIKMGNCVVVNAKTEKSDKAHSMSLKPETYVRDTNCESVAGRFQTLKKFSAFFKGQISEPLVACLKEDAGITADILRLYPEILILILKKLDLKSILSVNQCSRYLNGVSNDQQLWRSLVKRDFKEKGAAETVGPANDSKESYKQMYLLQKGLKKAHRLAYCDRMLAVHYPLPAPQPIPAPDPLGIGPSIIGGQRDLYPAGMVPPPGIGPFQPVRPSPARFYPPVPGGGLPGPRRDPDVFDVEDPLMRRRRFPSMYSDPFGGGSGFIL